MSPGFRPGLFGTGTRASARGFLSVDKKPPAEAGGMPRAITIRAFAQRGLTHDDDFKAATVLWPSSVKTWVR